jgi:hypothetical protein
VVIYRVAANTSDETRTGALRVESTPFPVTQAGRVPCAYDIDPLDRLFDSAGGAGTVAVSTRTDCPWTAVSDAAWLTITDGAQGLGPATVTYSVARHESSERRTASIRIADKIANVAQEPAPGPPGPCEYSVAPVDIRRHWHQTEGQFTLTTDPSCTWTAVSAAAWLGLATPSKGVGPITMAFTNSIYTGDTPRRAAIEVRWPTPTAGQNVWVTQDGCWYALAPDVRDVGVAGGPTQITVLASPASVDCNVGCPWTAQSLVSWVTITSSLPKSGDDVLFFRVDANPTGEARLGQIRVEHLFLTIRQADR